MLPAGAPEGVGGQVVEGDETQPVAVRGVVQHMVGEVVREVVLVVTLDEHQV